MKPNYSSMSAAGPLPTVFHHASCQQFEADVAAKMSDVAGAKTVMTESKTYLDRIRPLAEEKAVSQRDLDSAEAQYEVGISSVTAAQASLRAAKIQLGYTKIYSPVASISHACMNLVHYGGFGSHWHAGATSMT